MEQILFILLLYIAFGVIGPLLKRLQQSAPNTPAPQRSKEDAGSTANTLGQQFSRLQEAFQQPAERPATEPKTGASKLLSIPEKPARSKHRNPELIPPPLPAKPRVSTTYQPLSTRRQPAASSPPKTLSLLGFDRRRGYMQGIILSEILGPPVSKRPPRRRRP